jgi:hypothetical protein
MTPFPLTVFVVAAIAAAAFAGPTGPVCRSADSKGNMPVIAQRFTANYTLTMNRKYRLVGQMWVDLKVRSRFSPTPVTWAVCMHRMCVLKWVPVVAVRHGAWF